MSEKPSMALPDNGVVVSLTTIVDGKKRGTTVHVEHCHDGYPEVDYKVGQFLGGVIAAGETMKAQAVEDIAKQQPPPWKK